MHPCVSLLCNSIVQEMGMHRCEDLFLLVPLMLKKKQSKKKT